MTGRANEPPLPSSDATCRNCPVQRGPACGGAGGGALSRAGVPARPCGPGRPPDDLENRTHRCISCRPPRPA